MATAVATLVSARLALGWELAPEMQAAEPLAREKAARAILAEREELVQSLLALARRPTEPEPRHRGSQDVPSYPDREPKHLAIQLLGDLRAEEAVGPLFRDLIYYNPVMYGSYRSWAADFPAAVSLAKIGKPSVRPAIHKLAASDDELERELCCWIIEQVEGEELAPIVLQLAIDKEQYSSRKKRLQAALEYLQKEQ